MVFIIGLMVHKHLRGYIPIVVNILTTTPLVGIFTLWCAPWTPLVYHFLLPGCRVFNFSVTPLPLSIRNVFLGNFINLYLCIIIDETLSINNIREVVILIYFTYSSCHIVNFQISVCFNP